MGLLALVGQMHPARWRRLAVAVHDAAHQFRETGLGQRGPELGHETGGDGSALELEHFEVTGHFAADVADAGPAVAVGGADLVLGWTFRLVLLPSAARPLAAVLGRSHDADSSGVGGESDLK